MLHVEIPSREVLVSYDTNLMRRAIANLLSNALRYNPPAQRLRSGLSSRRMPCG